MNKEADYDDYDKWSVSQALKCNHEWKEHYHDDTSTVVCQKCEWIDDDFYALNERRNK